MPSAAISGDPACRMSRSDSTRQSCCPVKWQVLSPAAVGVFAVGAWCPLLAPAGAPAVGPYHGEKFGLGLADADFSRLARCFAASTCGCNPLLSWQNATVRPKIARVHDYQGSARETLTMRSEWIASLRKQRSECERGCCTHRDRPGMSGSVWSFLANRSVFLSCAVYSATRLTDWA